LIGLTAQLAEMVSITLELKRLTGVVAEIQTPMTSSLPPQIQNLKNDAIPIHLCSVFVCWRRIIWQVKQ
jgi:hypothetical protein